MYVSNLACILQMSALHWLLDGNEGGSALGIEKRITNNNNGRRQSANNGKGAQQNEGNTKWATYQSETKQAIYLSSPESSFRTDD